MANPQKMQQVLQKFAKLADDPKSARADVMGVLAEIVSMFRFNSTVKFRSSDQPAEMVPELVRKAASWSSTQEQQATQTEFCLAVVLIFYGLLNPALFPETAQFLRDENQIKPLLIAYQAHLNRDRPKGHLHVKSLEAAMKMAVIDGENEMLYVECANFMKCLVDNLHQYWSVIESVKNFVVSGCINETVGVNSLNQLTKLLVSADHRDIVSVIMMNLDFLDGYMARRSSLSDFGVNCLDEIASLAGENYLPEYLGCRVSQMEFFKRRVESSPQSLICIAHPAADNMKLAFRIVLETLDQVQYMEKSETLAVVLNLSESLSQILASVETDSLAIYSAFNRTRTKNSLGVTLVFASIFISNLTLNACEHDKIQFPASVNKLLAQVKLPPLPKPDFFFDKVKFTHPYKLSSDESLLQDALVACQAKILDLLNRFMLNEFRAMLDGHDSLSGKQILNNHLQVVLASHSLAVFSLECLGSASNLNIELCRVLVVDSVQQLLELDNAAFDSEYCWVLLIKLAQDMCMCDLQLAAVFLSVFDGVVERLKDHSAMNSASVRQTLAEYFELLDTNSSNLSALREFTGIEVNASKNMVSLPYESYQFLIEPKATSKAGSEATSESMTSMTDSSTRMSRSTNSTRQQSVHVDQFRKYSN